MRGEVAAIACASLILSPPSSDGGDGCFTRDLRQESGIAPPLSRTKLTHMFLQGVAWLILDCARRTSTALNLNIRLTSCAAFREQEDDQAASSPILYVGRAGTGTDQSASTTSY